MSERGLPVADDTDDDLVNVEIGDRADVTETLPGGGGFTATGFYVEGIQYEVEPLNSTYQMVTLSLDVSPATDFDVNPFPTS